MFRCCRRRNSDDDSTPAEGRLPAGFNNVPLPHHDKTRFTHITRILTTFTEPQGDISLSTVSDVFDQLDVSGEALAGLERFFNEHCSVEETSVFFNHTIPFIARLALDLPNLILHPIPYLRAQHQKTVTLTRVQVASLLACGFFCVMPAPYGAVQCNEVNFSRLYAAMSHSSSSIHAKFRCIIHYFDRLRVKMPQGHVVYYRRCIEPPSWKYWGGATEPLCDLELLEDGVIEDAGSKALLADFANKNIGGGVLSRGCVQEEIMFAVSPELICSLLFTEQMQDNEVVFISGTDRFSNYRGYGSDFEFVGDFVDPERGQKTIVAMDALMFHQGLREQLTDENLLREINKAHAAFSLGPKDKPTPIATGNWGCGAFGGDPEVKALVQIIVASRAKRPLWYYTFGDERVAWLKTTHKMLRSYDVNVGMLVEKLLQLAKNPPAEENFSVFEWISDNLLGDIDKVREKVSKRASKASADNNQV